MPLYNKIRFPLPFSDKGIATQKVGVYVFLEDGGSVQSAAQETSAGAPRPYHKKASPPTSRAQLRCGLPLGFF